MLEHPELADGKIADFVRDQYGLQVSQVNFLPTNFEYTAAYRIVTAEATAYFLKLKRDRLDEIALALLSFLHGRGLRHIIAPCATTHQRLWAPIDNLTGILYPFV